MIGGDDHDVLAHRQELEQQALAAIVTSWAPNCATFTRARELPIPGAAYSPPPLRSDSHPRGLPGLRGPIRDRVERDTQMAALAADQCWLAVERGDLFLLEHPGTPLQGL